MTQTVTLLHAGLLYCAALVLMGGLTARLVRYVRTPAPLPIPTTPAPRDRRGVAWRLLREAALFASLLRAAPWTWLWGGLFHAGLLIVTLCHLRYFTEPVWAPVRALQPFALYGAVAMAAGLIGLWLRRWQVDRIRHISAWSDYLLLALLLASTGSGLAMALGLRTDIVAVKDFCRSLLALCPTPLPLDPLLWLHLLLATVLAMIFPFSKLLHGPGLFFSPTRNQPDDVRERARTGHPDRRVSHADGQD